MSSKFCNWKLSKQATYKVVVQPNDLKVRELLKLLELGQATVRQMHLSKVTGVFSVLYWENAVGRCRVGLNFNHLLCCKKLIISVINKEVIKLLTFFSLSCRPSFPSSFSFGTCRRSGTRPTFAGSVWLRPPSPTFLRLSNLLLRAFVAPRLRVSGDLRHLRGWVYADGRIHQWLLISVRESFAFLW